MSVVHAIGTNKIIVSCRPLKGTRGQGTHSKQVNTFAESHTVSVQTDSKGTIMIKARAKEGMYEVGLDKIVANKNHAEYN